MTPNVVDCRVAGSVIVYMRPAASYPKSLLDEVI